MINNIRKNFFSGHERDTTVLINILLSFFIKGGNILVSMWIVPVTIGLINVEQYGVWLTVTSIVAWISFFDIGLGHGVRNNLAKEYASNNIDKSRKIVSTGYIVLSVFSIFFILLFLFISPFIDWYKALNVRVELISNLPLIMNIVFISISLQFVLKLINSILLSFQKTALSELILFLINIFTLFFILIVKYYFQPSLLILSILSSVIPILVYLFFTVLFFSNNYQKLSPRLRFFEFSLCKPLFNLGLSFFIIQLAIVVLYQSGNIIISHLFGSVYVTQYNIAYRYFSVIMIFFTIIVNPLWSAFTEAYIKNDKLWIRKTINRINIVWFFSVLLTILMLIVSNYIYKLWIGDSVNIEFKLSAIFVLYVSIFNWNRIYTQFVNGVSKLRLQLYITLFIIALNIPLSIFLAKNCNFGLVGIVLASCISQLIYAVFMPIQYKKIMNGTAKGIWNR